MARVVTAIVTSISSPDRPRIRFRPVDQTVFGITASGQTLHDTRLTVSGTAFTSSELTSDTLSIALGDSISLAATLDEKVATFFRLGLEEEDFLKRFLYFFLSIEVQVHRTFATIDHDSHVSDLSQRSERIDITSTSFFSNKVKSWPNLKDRLIWCAHCVWFDLNQSDVIEFSRLKRIRDSIAHGDTATPNESDVIAVEKFSIKLQKQSQIALISSPSG
jgi:hypothetical protein